MSKKHQKKLMKLFVTLLVMIVATVVGYLKSNIEEDINSELLGKPQVQQVSFDIEEIPEFDGENSYIILNNNIPEFYEEDLTTKSFEQYSELDELGRCGVAFANIGIDIMPTEDRESIGQVKPTGWQTVKYDCVDG